MPSVTTPRHLWLMLALTFSTGIVDAIGYLGLDRVFTANMTGNVVILGMGLVGAQGLPVVGPVLALVGFLVGAAAAGAAFRSAGAGWSARTTAVLAVVAVGLGALAVALVLGAGAHEPGRFAVTGVLGGVMGAQAAAARHVGVKDVTTVVITSTMTGLAADSWFGNRTGAHVPRRGGAVVLMLIGAAAGALLLRWHPGAGVALSALITAAVTAVGHADLRRNRPETSPA